MVLNADLWLASRPRLLVMVIETMDDCVAMISVEDVEGMTCLRLALLMRQVATGRSMVIK